MENKLGSLASQKLQIDPQIEKKDILLISRRDARSRKVAETNETVKDLRNSYFQKIEKI